MNVIDQELFLMITAVVNLIIALDEISFIQRVLCAGEGYEDGIFFWFI